MPHFLKLKEELKMIINHNLTAMNAYRNLTGVNDRVNKSMEKLSSGMRINRAGDDAAGLAISEKMRGQIKGLNMATKNAQDSISMIQTAEGALNETHSILQRMRELAVQSANDTNTDVDRTQIQKEMDRLRQEIDRISTTTEFNTKKLINGDFIQNPLSFHIGANEDQVVTLNINDMGAESLGVIGFEEVTVTDPETGETTTKRIASEDQAISVKNSEDAEIAITSINDAIESVSDERSKFGALQNRLEHTINNLRVSSENLQAAESRIRDTDMASEMVNLSKDKIISQSGNAMLAQANAQPQGVLQLLQG
jgi:flagellin